MGQHIDERQTLKSLESYIHSVAKRYFGDSYLAADAAQEARYVIVREIRRWRGDKPIRNHLLAKTWRFIADFRKYESRRAKWVSDEDFEFADSADLERAYSVREHMGRLSDRQRKALLRVIAGDGRSNDKHYQQALSEIQKMH